MIENSPCIELIDGRYTCKNTSRVFTSYAKPPIRCNCTEAKEPKNSSLLTTFGKIRLDRCLKATCGLLHTVKGSTTCVGMGGSKCTWLRKWMSCLNGSQPFPTGEYTCPFWSSEDQPLILIVGLHRSLSSCLAGVLQHLGVNMGNRLNNGHEDLSLQEICEEYMPFPSSEKPEDTSRLKTWLCDKLKQGSIIGAKYPTLIAFLKDIEQLHPNLQIIHSSRPFEESVESLVTRSSKPGNFPATREQCEKLQAYLYSELRAFLATRKYLTVEADDLLSDPQGEIDRICNYLGLTPSASSIQKAVAFVDPIKAPHCSIVQGLATSHWQRNTTLCIKSFERPQCLHKCLKTFRQKYPICKIKVADDSCVTTQNNISDICREFSADFIPIPYDSGLSIGRNTLVDTIDTPYTFLVDDDVIFGDNADIECLYQALRLHKLDLAAASCRKDGVLRPFEGHFKIVGEYLIQQYGSITNYNGISAYNIVNNVWLAKTDSIKPIRWEDSLKLGEHIDWFLKAWLAELKITYMPNVVIDDTADRPTEVYKKARNRCLDYHNETCDRWCKYFNARYLCRWLHPNFDIRVYDTLTKKVTHTKAPPWQ